MTVLESVRKFISTCPHLREFAQGIGVDFLSEEATSYSIEEVPANPIVKKYIDGSSIRQFIFIFSSREAYGSDAFINLDNIGFYEKFYSWIEEQNLNKNLPEIKCGKSVKIEALTNGYAFETDIDKARYQIQCKLTYFKEAK